MSLTVVGIIVCVGPALCFIMADVIVAIRRMR